MLQDIQAKDLGSIRTDKMKDTVEQLRRMYELVPVDTDLKKIGSTRTLEGDRLTVTCSIPFIGDADLLQYRPSTFRMEVVPGTVSEGKIVVEISGHLDMTNFKRELERWSDSLNFWLENVKKDVEHFNRHLPSKIQSTLEERIKMIRKADDEMKRMGLL